VDGYQLAGGLGCLMQIGEEFVEICNFAAFDTPCVVGALTHIAASFFDPVGRTKELPGSNVATGLWFATSLAVGLWQFVGNGSACNARSVAPDLKVNECVREILMDLQGGSAAYLDRIEDYMRTLV
jgi:hypothetical protein